MFWELGAGEQTAGILPGKEKRDREASSLPYSKVAMYLFFL